MNHFQTMQEKSKRSLAAARLLSTISFCLLGALVVDMPDGLLGEIGSLSSFARGYIIILTVFGSIAIYGLYQKSVWALPIADILVVLSVGVFAIGVSSDPVRSGALMLWLMYVGVMLLFFTRFPVPSKRKSLQYLSEIYQEASALKLWFAGYRESCSHLLLATIVQTALVFGFDLIQTKLAVHVVLSMNLIAILISIRFLALMWKHDLSTRRQAVPVLLLFCFAIITFPLSKDAALAFLFLFQCAVFIVITARSPLAKEGINRFKEAPALFVLVSFVGLIAAGALFLSLPEASATGKSIGAVHAIFTAVSAACVTGLTVLKTGSELSAFGQTIVLVLVQLGGLGIMVLSTFATIAFGGRLGVKTEKTFAEFFESKGARSTQKLVIFIIKSTLIIEAVGALVLTYFYHQNGMSIGAALKHGIFQAISAFCNAGFSLHDDSLMSVNGSPLALMTYGILIVVGGLGFFVMLELISRLRGKKSGPMSVQAKLVLLMTSVLIVSGWLLFTMTEWNNAFAQMTVSEKIWNGLFHSITLRTAGFNSVGLQTFTNASFVAMLVLMFVGAAPGGTSGGVKVTTLGVLLATLPALLKENNRVSIFNRRISAMTVYKAAALVVLSLLTICFFWFILLLTQNVEPMALLFEIVSAVGTVGLSVGATEQLDAFGEIIISIAMFIGRIGPLTVAIALAQESKSKIKFPDANVMIG